MKQEGICSNRPPAAQNSTPAAGRAPTAAAPSADLGSGVSQRTWTIADMSRVVERMEALRLTRSGPMWECLPEFAAYCSQGHRAKRNLIQARKRAPRSSAWVWRSPGGVGVLHPKGWTGSEKQADPEEIQQNRQTDSGRRDETRKEKLKHGKGWRHVQSKRNRQEIGLGREGRAHERGGEEETQSRDTERCNI